MEEQRRLKQKYLVGQIIDQGYDASEFTEFIGKKKADGTDIDNWTYDELIAEVQEFKNMKDQQRGESVSVIDFATNVTDGNEAFKFDKPPAQQPPVERVDLQRQDSAGWSPQQATTEVGRNKLSQCYVLKCEKVKAGLFSTVDEYTIETLPFKYLVKRKYNEFVWLREQFATDFPGLYVD